MKQAARQLAGIILLVAAMTCAAGEMKDTLNLGANASGLRTMFSTYGFQPKQSILREIDGFRFKLPAKQKIEQTGVYSSFTLAGDCEVIACYELVKMAAPKAGYGSSVGLVFDAGKTIGWGSIQCGIKVAEGSGYSLQVNMADGGEKPAEEYRFLPSKDKKGRIGLRRLGQELVFLASKDMVGELDEVGRLPFTDKTIRGVRFYADPGGSPTLLDVRVWGIQAHAEQITSSIPLSEKPPSNRWWLWMGLAVLAGGAALGVWYWLREPGK